jgi:hypothetical protein
MAANLAPVYLDNERVTLQGDPKPRVAKIVEAGGKKPDKVQVVRLKSQTDFEGRPVRLDEIIDRTVQSNNPVYLKCVDKGNPASAGAGKGKEWKGQPSGSTQTAPKGQTQMSDPTFPEAESPEKSMEEESGEHEQEPLA